MCKVSTPSTGGVQKQDAAPKTYEQAKAFSNEQCYKDRNTSFRSFQYGLYFWPKENANSTRDGKGENISFSTDVPSKKKSQGHGY